MSIQMYWCAVGTKLPKKQKLWPITFHKTRGAAHLECIRWNNHWRKREFKVKRVLLETKDAVHYDVYEHEFKRIEK